MTSEQIERIKHLDECLRHNYRVSSQEVTDLYNSILNKNVANTNCGSCIRRRVQELTTALAQWESEENQRKMDELIKEKTVVIDGNVKIEEAKPKKKAKK